MGSSTHSASGKLFIDLLIPDAADREKMRHMVGRGFTDDQISKYTGFDRVYVQQSRRLHDTFNSRTPGENAYTTDPKYETGETFWLDYRAARKASERLAKAVRRIRG